MLQEFHSQTGFLGTGFKNVNCVSFVSLVLFSSPQFYFSSPWPWRSHRLPSWLVRPKSMASLFQTRILKWGSISSKGSFSPQWHSIYMLFFLCRRVKWACHPSKLPPHTQRGPQPGPAYTRPAWGHGAAFLQYPRPVGMWAFLQEAGPRLITAQR